MPPASGKAARGARVPSRAPNVNQRQWSSWAHAPVANTTRCRSPRGDPRPIVSVPCRRAPEMFGARGGTRTPRRRPCRVVSAGRDVRVPERRGRQQTCASVNIRQHPSASVRNADPLPPPHRLPNRATRQTWTSEGVCKRQHSSASVRIPRRNPRTPGGRRGRPCPPRRYGNIGCCNSPVVSSRPHIRFMFWMAWPLEPLTRLSMAAMTMARPGMRSGKTPRMA